MAVRLEPKEGHAIPIVRARLGDGPSFALILDTGGNNTMISEAAASGHDIGPVIGTGKIATAFGNQRPSELVLARELSMGGLTLRGAPVLVHHFTSTHEDHGLGSELNVLGTPAMACFSYISFDYPRQRVIFSLKEPFSPPPRGSCLKLPLTVEKDGHFSVPVRFHDGKKRQVLVDTGYDGVLLVSRQLVDELGVGHHAAQGVQVRAIGPGAATTGSLFSLPGMEVAGCEFTDVEAWTGGTSSGTTLLGSGFLRRFRATFDFRRLTLWLEVP